MEDHSSSDSDSDFESDKSDTGPESGPNTDSPPNPDSSTEEKELDSGTNSWRESGMSEGRLIFSSEFQNPTLAAPLPGTLAFVIGYVFLWFFGPTKSAVVNSLPESVSEGVAGLGFGKEEFVSWVFYSAHFVPLEISFGDTSENFNLLIEVGGDHLAFFLLPPVLLLATGVVSAQALTNRGDTRREKLKAGIAGGLGYSTPAIALVFVSGFSSSSGIPVSMGVEKIIAIPVAGLVYPVAFSAIGGYYSDTVTRERVKNVARASFVAVMAFLIGILIFAFIANFLFAGGYDPDTDPAVFVAAQFLGLQGVAFGGVAVFYLRVSGLGLDFIKARVPNLRDVVWVIAGFFFFVALAIVINEILAYFEVESASNQIEEIGANNPEIFLLLIPFSFLIIGPGEELLYRGIVQGSLRRRFGPVSAIAIASILFASIHVFALTGTGSRLIYLAVVFVLSLILGGVYERTENLVVPALIHGAYNALLFLAMYLRTTSGEEVEVIFFEIQGLLL